MKYYSLLTKKGIEVIVDAQTSQRKIQIDNVAIGDANGTLYEPTGDETVLVNEIWRGGVTNITVDSVNPNWLVFESVVPATVGGFTLREVGYYDSDNNLIAIGNYPEIYKPSSADGTVMDLILRTIIEFNNTSAISIEIDPNVVVASKRYVDEKFAEALTDISEHIEDESLHLQLGERSKWDTHVSDSEIHVQPGERIKWNNVGTGLASHIADTTPHLQSGERGKINSVGNASELLTENKVLVPAINELFISFGSFKSKIASATTDMGVHTNADATGDQMAANIRSIQTGKSFQETIPTPPIASNQVNVQVLTTLLDFKPDYIMTDWGGVVYENGWNRGPAALDFQYVSGFGVIPEDGKWRIRVSLGNTKTTTHPSSTVTVFAFKIS